MKTPEPIDAIRLRNLRTLRARYGSQTILADAIGLTASALSQYIGKTPTRAIGSTQARVIESALNLPVGWLDVQHGEGEQGGVTHELVDPASDEGRLLAMFRTLPVHDRDEMIKLAEKRMEENAPMYSPEELLELNLFKQLTSAAKNSLLHVAARMPKSSLVILPYNWGGYEPDEIMYMANYRYATAESKEGLKQTLRTKLQSASENAAPSFFPGANVNHVG